VAPRAGRCPSPQQRKPENAQPYDSTCITDRGASHARSGAKRGMLCSISTKHRAQARPQASTHVPWALATRNMTHANGAAHAFRARIALCFLDNMVNQNKYAISYASYGSSKDAHRSS
jgi:hypothetical protein